MDIHKEVVVTEEAAMALAFLVGLTVGWYTYYQSTKPVVYTGRANTEGFEVGSNYCFVISGLANDAFLPWIEVVGERKFFLIPDAGRGLEAREEAGDFDYTGERYFLVEGALMAGRWRARGCDVRVVAPEWATITVMPFSERWFAYASIVVGAVTFLVTITILVWLGGLVI